MKKQLLFSLLSVLLFSFGAGAAITVTPGTGGSGICANLAQTGSAPAFTTLTDIVLTEGVATDITGGFHALVLSAPTGWRFNTGAVPTAASTGTDIFFVNVAGMTATTVTVNILAFGTANINTITISGLQVQATTTGAGAGNITASSAPGLTGVSTGSTNFGSLSLTPSLTPSVSIAASPSAFVCEGVNVTFTATPVNGGTPTYQWYVAGSPVAGATNSTFSSSTLVSGNNVRVQMIPTGCVTASSAVSNIITMTVNATPAAVTVSGGGTFCNNTTLTASLSGAGTIYYQGATFNGTSTATASSTAFISTPGTNTYYFRARSAGGCWGPQGSAAVTIHLAPSAIAITPTTTTSFCLGDSATFMASATASSTEVLFEDFNSGAPGWTISNLAGTSTSYFQIRTPPGYSNATPGDGTDYMQAAADATGSFSLPTHTMITSPSFSLAGYTAASISFNQFYFEFINDTMAGIEYSIDGGASWTNIVNQAGVTAGTPSWTTLTPSTTVAMPAGALGQPDVRLRWRYNSPWGWYWAIDNIRVTGSPTLTYNWVGVSGADGLSCSTCDTVTITPSTAGVHVYSVSSSLMGCTTVAGLTITVNPLPMVYTVTGGGAYCAGGTGVSVGLSGSDAGVDYQLYNGSTMTGSPVSGTGSALDFGLQTAAGTYSVMAGDAGTTCSADMSGTVDVIVNPLPTVYNVTGGGAICAGDTGVHVGLSGSDTGISYQLYDGGGATVGSAMAGTGSALDFGLFTTAGTFTVVATDTTTLCTSDMADSAVVTVNPLPMAYNVTGGGLICPSGPGANVGLSGSDAGINYQLYNGASTVGAAMAGTGASLDFGAQTAAGTYTVLATDGTSACINAMNDSAVITIASATGPITGTASLCVGDTTMLADTTAGGTWTSSDTAVAIVDATGKVSGMSAGTADITYTPVSGCFVTQTVTVNALPIVPAITGSTNICLGDSTTLMNDSTGGVWSSGDAAIAAIDASTGVVTGAGAGATTVSYTITDGAGCSTTVTMADTVTAPPVVDPIDGATVVCTGSTITLTDATAGGVWSSSDAATASVDASGVVSGVAAGSATISYTVTAYPGCSTTVTADETVSDPPTVAAITGDSVVCSGASILLADATTGGTWSSSDVTVATVTAGGIVSGVAPGSVDITYTVVNSAGCSDYVVRTINVGSSMAGVTILPTGTYVSMCGGSPVNLVATIVGGITYQWADASGDISGATNNSYIATMPGVYSLTIDNGTCHVTLPSKTVLPDPVATIAYNATGDYLFTGTFVTYQWYKDGTAIAGATNSLYFSPTAGDYTVVVTDMGGCTDTSAVFTVMPAGVGSAPVQVAVKVYPNPASSVVYIDAPVKTRVSVMAADGRIVMPVQEAASIDVHNLAGGIYQVMVYDNNGQLLKVARLTKID